MNVSFLSIVQGCDLSGLNYWRSLAYCAREKSAVFTKISNYNILIKKIASSKIKHGFCFKC